MRTGLSITLFVCVFLLFVIFNLLFLTPPTPQKLLSVVPYSTFLDQMEQGNVREVNFRGTEISGSFNDGKLFSTYIPPAERLVERLLAKKVTVTVSPVVEEQVSAAGVLISWLLPSMLLFAGLWLFLGLPLRRIERRLEILGILVRPAPGGEQERGSP
jgi:cell division protease FtsH